MEAADTGQTAVQAGSGLGFEGSPRAISAVGEFVHEALESGQNRPRRRRGWLVRRMLLAADLVGLLSAFLIVQAIYKNAPGTDTLSSLSELAVFVLFLPLWIVLAKLHGLYERDDERTDHSTVDDIPGVFRLVTIGAWLTLTATWLTGFVQPNPHRLLASWALAIVLITLSRASARAFCRRRTSYLQNTIVVGAGDIGQLVARKIMNHPEYGLNIVGFVDETPKERREDLGHLTLLGGPDELPPLIPLLDVERVVVAFSGARHEETLQLIRSLKHYDVQIDIVPRLFEIVGTNSGLHGVEGLPLIGLPPASLSRSSLALKRAFDVTLSLFALIVLAPLLGLIAAVVKFSSQDPFSSARSALVSTIAISRSTSSGRWSRMLTSGSLMSHTSMCTREREAIHGCSRCPTIRASRVSAGTCGAIASTSFRSYSMCSPVTCHSSARGR